MKSDHCESVLLYLVLLAYGQKILILTHIVIAEWFVYFLGQQHVVPTTYLLQHYVLF